MYDRTCTFCPAILVDCLEPITAPEVPCPECGKATVRTWLPDRGDGGGGVIGDDIPGGMWVRHGICNPDGSPRKYYSKSEMAREAAKRGLVNHSDAPDYVPKNRVYFT